MPAFHVYETIFPNRVDGSVTIVKYLSHKLLITPCDDVTWDKLRRAAFREETGVTFYIPGKGHIWHVLLSCLHPRGKVSAANQNEALAVFSREIPGKAWRLLPEGIANSIRAVLASA